MRLAWFAVTTCALACDPGAPARPASEMTAAAPPRDFVSGSRLRARYHVVEGLIEVFTTFHDLELDVDCAYEDESGAHVGPNATSYCFPSGMARHREGTGPYLDPACTTRAAFAAASAANGPATYALVEARDACTTAPEVHLVTAPEQRSVFLVDERGACVAAAGDSVQRFAGVVPLDTFVHAVEHAPPRDGRITSRVLVGNDGSSRVVGGYDRARGEPSRVGLASDGSRRWLPSRTAFVGGGELLFADGACVTPAAAKIARTATCPLGAALVLDGSCGGGRYFELGERMSTAFARDEARACVAREASQQLVFGLGAVIPTSSYAPAFSVDVGGSRVRRRGMSGAGDVPATWAEVIDVATGEPCEVATLGDGSLRCLPSASAAVAFFADDACTEPAFARALTGCEVGPSARLVRDAFDDPPKVFEVGRELDAVFTVEAGRCVRFTPTVPSRLFAASEVDPSRFPGAVLASE